MNLDLQWYDWIGILGTLMVLGAFFLLQAGKIHGNRLAYQLLNLLGAAGVLVSLVGKFNFPVLLLEGAWIVISLYGIVRTFRKGSQASA
ncbi:hypothetical protein FNZ56_04875 [Pseudoluteimonas lycopersici]|uniref:CBU-0592-like domain-containing protein n=1 Tax=Pseudoluteimonas lycopersici TaxID=1324796 RepID=A0A516V3Y1_9GAMM|nr:hypothetical protein [Lysobacter lycopersici]QDQ73245.1 hypothetical protein FNZ56_04875 [Lysobacter lycopersici]